MKWLGRESGIVTAVSFSHDGKFIASGYGTLGALSGEVRLWDAHTGALNQTLTDHEHGVSSALFSPNGKLIASCGADASVRLWEVGGARLLATLMVLPGAGMDVASNEWITFTPDGHYTGSTEARQFIRWRTGNIILPAETAQSRLPHSRHILRM
ncbi:MAG: WD40 repeat domain-containing protein [Blastocatellia bacterium]